MEKKLQKIHFIENIKHHIFIINLLLMVIFTSLMGCKKKDLSAPETPIRVPKPEGTIVYSTALLDSVSKINKTTSWYNTNKSFDELFDEKLSLFSGFELKPDSVFLPYNFMSQNTWSPTKNYYWFSLGSYVYTDLTGDGKKDLWAFYWKNPWPTNSRGLHFFSENPLDEKYCDLQFGLTEVRKCVLADLDNDKKNEVVLFSTGYDSIPFPGDSIAIFYPSKKKYVYLSDDIGYFQGGATGDINGDGFVDIICYSGGSKTVPIHPAAYINKGNNVFQLSKNVFSGFTINRDDNYYTVELFDVNADGLLDLILGGTEKMRVIINKAGTFNRTSAIDIPIQAGLGLMDFSFLDFDGDGKIDILTLNNKDLYQGYSLRLFLNRGSKFIDVTKDYFNVFEGNGKKVWIKWLRLFDIDKDGDVDIVADGLYGELYDNKTKMYWRNDAGYFTQVKH